MLAECAGYRDFLDPEWEPPDYDVYGDGEEEDSEDCGYDHTCDDDDDDY